MKLYVSRNRDTRDQSFLIKNSLSGIFILSLALNSSCSMSSSESRTIRIEFPESLLKKNERGYQIQSGGSQPTSISSFTCFGINVVGPGIPPDFRLGCSNPAAVGKIGGLAPIKGGAVEITVPAGPQRTVQLFALQSEVGCPSVDQILSTPPSAPGAEDHRFDGLGEPYLVGSGVADTFSDTQITIKASFDPSKPKRVFENCGAGRGGGDSIPLTLAVTGSYDPLAGSNPQGMPFQLTPSSAPGAPELLGASLVSSTDLKKIQQFEPQGSTVPNLENSVIHQVAGSATASRRAVIQLQWDVSSLDLQTNPYLDVEIQMAGGNIGPTCTTASHTFDGVHAAIYLAQNHQWMYGGYHSSAASLGFARIVQSPVVAAFTKSDGKKYIIVNLETTAVSQDAGCRSVVAVAGANLRLRSSPPSVATPPPTGPTTPFPTPSASPSVIINYSMPFANYVVGAPIPTNVPTITGGTASSFTVSPALPAGLSINNTSGVISGTPSTGSPSTVYMVSAITSSGTTSIPLNLGVYNPCFGLPSVPSGILQVWLDATKLQALGQGPGTQVSNWAGCLATPAAIQATAPMYPLFQLGIGPNGAPAVSFDGVDDFLYAPASVNLAAGATYIVLARLETTSGQLQNGKGIIGKGDISTLTDAFTLETGFSTPNNNLKVNTQSNGMFSPATPPLPVDVWMILTSSVTSGGARSVEMIFNNILANSMGAGAYVANTTYSLIIGGQQTGPSAIASGKVSFAEVLVYNGALTPADRRIVECYLKAKYGLGFYSNPSCP